MLRFGRVLRGLFVPVIFLAGVFVGGPVALEGKSLSEFFSWGKKAGKKEAPAPLPVPPQVMNFQDTFARVASQVKPAVVNITAVHIESVEVRPHQFFFGDPFEFFFDDFHGRGRQRRRPAPKRFERRQEGMGSGVVVDPKGLILTNAHVVTNADKIQVRLPDTGDKVFEGKVVGLDVRSDLAVVKIKPGKDLAYASLGDSEKIRVGDWALAVGSPFGLEQTVTAGIISAVRQSLNLEGKIFHNMIQTDASINRGNSGGPLVNIQGEVIGINTAIYAPTGVFNGIGFAIPSNYAKDIMGQLIEKGKVVRGWLGVEIAPLDEVMAAQFQVPGKKGVLINRVMAGSPAAKAGLKRGDVVIGFHGEKVESPADLQRIVAKTAPKTKVKVSVVRDGREKAVDLVTGERPEQDRALAESRQESAPESDDVFEWEGARVVALSDVRRKQESVPADVKGVFVQDLDPNGMAAHLSLQPGDVVVSLNRVGTPTLKAFKSATKKADWGKGVLADVLRRGRRFYLSYKKS